MTDFELERPPEHHREKVWCDLEMINRIFECYGEDPTERDFRDLTRLIGKIHSQRYRLGKKDAWRDQANTIIDRFVSMLALLARSEPHKMTRSEES